MEDTLKIVMSELLSRCSLHDHDILLMAFLPCFARTQGVPSTSGFQFSSRGSVDEIPGLTIESQADFYLFSLSEALVLGYLCRRSMALVEAGLASVVCAAATRLAGICMFPGPSATIVFSTHCY